MSRALDQALSFIAEHGVVLASAKGPAPRLIEAIAGEPIRGNWWSHPNANEIYRVLSEACESEQVLVCRLVGARITLVHSRLWPALVRLADRFAPEQLCHVRTEHTASGRHAVHETPFDEWAPAEVVRQGREMSEADAVALLEPWLSVTPAPRKRDRKR